MREGAREEHQTLTNTLVANLPLIFYGEYDNSSNSLGVGIEGLVYTWKEGEPIFSRLSAFKMSLLENYQISLVMNILFDDKSSSQDLLHLATLPSHSSNSIPALSSFLPPGAGIDAELSNQNANL